MQFCKQSFPKLCSWCACNNATTEQGLKWRTLTLPSSHNCLTQKENLFQGIHLFLLVFVCLCFVCLFLLKFTINRFSDNLKQEFLSDHFLISFHYKHWYLVTAQSQIQFNCNYSIPSWGTRIAQSSSGYINIVYVFLLSLIDVSGSMSKGTQCTYTYMYVHVQFYFL